MLRIMGLAIAAAIFTLALPAQPAKPDKVKVSEAAMKIHQDCLVFDGHNDLPWELRTHSDGGFTKIDIARPQQRLHTDIPRLRKGGVGAQFWSAYVPASTAGQGKAVTRTLEQIDTIHRMIAAYPDVFQFAGSTADILAARQSGKIASLIGVEGGHSIDNSLGVLRMFYRLGVRYMTLTHSDTLDWADSATDAAKSNGLSPLGEQVVAEMNRLGMLVDISHVAPSTMHHVLRICQAPVIASHSSAYALAGHPRNVPDDVLKLLKPNGGVVMINFYSGFIMPEGAEAGRLFLAEYREMKKQIKDDAQIEKMVKEWFQTHPIPRGTVHHVVDHIEHVIKVAGIDHVGIGSDFDGVPKLPEQLDDVSCYPVITQILLDRGYSAADIKKILFGNIFRALGGAEETAKKLQAAANRN